MRRSRWRGQRTGFGVFILGTGMGMITNLVTGEVERWPRALQPIATYAPGIGAGLIVAFGAKALWDLWRGGLERPEWTGSNPYPGLVAYTEKWAGVFFGRSPEVHELLIRVRDARTAAGRFVPVVGPSGSGKSSVVLAGLLPALRDEWQVLPVFAPGTNAVGELADVLGGVDLSVPARAVLAAARAGAPAPRLEAVLPALHALRAGKRRVLLVVDQLEETVTQGVEEDRHAFLALLEALLEQEPRLRVVATVRSDTIGAFQQGPGRELFHDPLMVNVMGPREIRLVIREPARLTATTFEDGLAEEMVRDAGGGDALPLLSYLLSDLYRNVARDRHISWREYRDSGGVSGAITRRADAAVRELGPDALEFCLDTLLLFVTLGPGGATRQRVLGSILAGRQRAVVRAFVDARLLVSDEAAGAGDTVYDIAHEALLRQWEPLAQHIARHEEALRHITELAPMARAWLRSARQADYLITGARLADALSWASRGGRALSPDVREFLDESQRNQAGEMERRANRVAQEALAALADEPETACALALAAYTELAPTPLAAYALEMSLASGLLRSMPHAGIVAAVAFDASGRLATACADGIVRIWPPIGPPPHELTGHVGGASAVAFAPDGSLATADHEGTVRIWSPDGRLAHTLERPGAVRTVLAYTVDGPLAIGGTGGVELVDAALKSVRTLPGSAAHGAVYAVAAAADGRVAAGCADGAVLAWDAHGQPVSAEAGHGDCVLAVAFGPDGRLASSGRDGALAVRDGAGLVREMRERRRKAVTSLAYAPDGSLACGLEDGEVRVWHADGRLAHVLTEGRDEVASLAFAGDGRLAAGFYDAAARIWDPGGRLVWTVADDSRVVRFMPDGRVAIGPAEGGIRLQTADQADHTAVTLSTGGNAVDALAVAADGSLASADTDRYVRVWEPAATEPSLVRSSRGNKVMAVAFLPDGRLVVGDHDGAVWLWDSQGPSQLLIRTRKMQALACTPDSQIAVLSLGLLWIGPGGERGARAPQSDATAVAVSPDGRWAVGRSDGATELWTDPARPPLVLSGHSGRLTAAAFAADGRLATAAIRPSGEGELRVWNREGQLLLALIVDGCQGTSELVFAPDGRLAVRRGGLVCVWPHGTAGEVLTALAARYERQPLTARQRDAAMLTVSREGKA
jgi:WD40 repeat protein